MENGETNEKGLLDAILLTFKSMAIYIKCEGAVFLFLMAALSKDECHDSKKSLLR